MGSVLEQRCGFIENETMRGRQTADVRWRWAKLFATSAKVKRFGQSNLAIA